MGFPLSGFSRMFTNYSYERVRVTEINELYQDAQLLARNPFLSDSLLIGQGGERIVSKVVPSYVYNTVDQPIFRPAANASPRRSIWQASAATPTSTSRWSRALVPEARQPAHARDARPARIHPHLQRIQGAADFREGVPWRRVQHPRLRHSHRRPQASNGLVLGGNKSLLFNVEEQITIAGPVRLIAFYDAGRCSPDRRCRAPAFVPEADRSRRPSSRARASL